MALSINQEIRMVFELATLRREARAIETPGQWREIAVLQGRCQQARTHEKELYAARYDARVETRRRQLIHEAGAKGRSHKPLWAAHDGFDPETTLRQAQRDVRAAHAARLQKIDALEHSGLNAMLRELRRLNRRRGVLREDFSRASERRSGIERRRIRKMEH